MACEMPARGAGPDRVSMCNRLRSWTGVRARSADRPHLLLNCALAHLNHQRQAHRRPSLAQQPLGAECASNQGAVLSDSRRVDNPSRRHPIRRASAGALPGGGPPPRSAPSAASCACRRGPARRTPSRTPAFSPTTRWASAAQSWAWRGAGTRAPSSASTRKGVRSGRISRESSAMVDSPRTAGSGIWPEA